MSILGYMKNKKIFTQPNNMRSFTRRKTVIQGFFAILLIFVGSVAMLGASEPFSLSDFLQSDQTAEVPDAELRRFGETLMEIQQIQIDANENIQQAIESSVLPEQRLEEIFAMAQEDPENAEDMVEQSEWTAYTKVIESLVEIQVETQEDMITVLEENDYEVEEFNSLANIIQDRPELIQRLQSLFNTSS